MKKFFEKFAKSDFGLEIWSKDKIIFRSKKEGIQGLLEFIKKQKNKKINKEDLVIFDKKVGNAVALLCAYLKATKVYGIIGSELAKKTLKKFGIKFHFSKMIPNILNKEKTTICPMEQMSFQKTPKIFLDLLKTKNFC